MQFYFTDFAHTDLALFENDIMQASSKAEELSKETIYVENCLNQTYIYTLVATPISPNNFHHNLKIENGIVVSYSKYQFEIPEEINQNAVYIIKTNENKRKELLKNGFESEKCGEFYVLWQK